MAEVCGRHSLLKCDIGMMWFLIIRCMKQADTYSKCIVFK